LEIYERTKTFVFSIDKDFALFKDLDMLPQFPYHLFEEHLDKYDLGLVMSARGCPYNCIFCSQKRISGGHYRYRSPEKVMEDLDLLINKYGLKRVEFLDDNFSYDEGLIAWVVLKYSDFTGTAIERSNAAYLLNRYPRFISELVEDRFNNTTLIKSLPIKFKCMAKLTTRIHITFNHIPLWRPIIITASAIIRCTNRIYTRFPSGAITINKACSKNTANSKKQTKNSKN